MDAMMQRERTENCAAMQLGFEALDEALKHGFIRVDKWAQAVEDVYRFPKAVADFLSKYISKTQPYQGWALANYLKQFHRQED